MTSMSDVYKVSEQAKGYPINGFVAPGYEPVLEVFKENFLKRDEIGAACAVFRGRTPVVDLWGGYRDKEKTELWQADTMACVHSSTKAIMAIAMAMAASRGYFRLDDTVASHWPEFAQNGKQDITIRQILDHSAGLPVVEELLTLEQLADYEGLGEILARQKTQWEPGTRHGYHGWTIGMYSNEIMRRTDPQGRTVGEFVREEILPFLKEEFYIGLPDAIPDDRIATEIVTSKAMLAAVLSSPLTMLAMMLPARLRKNSLMMDMLNNPAEAGQLDQFGTRELRRIELPGGNGIGTARAMAHIMGVCAAGGEALGISPESIAEFERTHPNTGKHEVDAVMGKRVLFQAGMMKPNSDLASWLARPRCYFHGGGGGNFIFADPDSNSGFGYCNNRMDIGLDFPRSDALIEAMLECELVS